jgi:hypothetical protein
MGRRKLFSTSGLFNVIVATPLAAANRRSLIPLSCGLAGKLAGPVGGLAGLTLAPWS